MNTQSQDMNTQYRENLQQLKFLTNAQFLLLETLKRKQDGRPVSDTSLKKVMRYAKCASISPEAVDAVNTLASMSLEHSTVK